MLMEQQLLVALATNKSGDVGECNVNEWMTHPAFISFDVDGFWAGKFETGYKGSTSKETAEVDSNDSTKVIVKPSTNSWRYIIIKNMFEASYNYERALDSHMMKNTEFGAIAYLSHSKYGIGKEVNINNNSKYITGCGATPGSVASDTCNNYTTVLGMGASTTGNIYGIYDLSGGAFEYAASYLENQYNDSVFDATSIAKYESKYFDVYKKSAINSRTDYTGRILGDSTGELGPFKDYRNSWYSDHANFPSVDSTYRNPWFGRGGSYSSAIEAGQFAFNWGSGGHDKNNSFFIALAPQ